MANRRRARPRRAESTAPVHREIERQAAAMWALFERTRTPAPHYSFPAVAELYEAVLGAVKQARGPRYPRSVSYCGRRYGVEVTSFGRLRVLAPGTRSVIVVGGIGAVW